MNEHETELADCIRILWRGKWIVVVCFVLAVAAAAVYTVVQPTRYSLATTYSVHETVSLYVPSASAEALASRALQTLPELDAGGLQRSLTRRDPAFIDLTITGVAAPKEVEAALDSSVAALTSCLVAQVEYAVSQERARADLESLQIAEQLALLRQQAAAETGEVVLKAYGEQMALLGVRRAEAAVESDGLSKLTAGNLVSLLQIRRGAVIQVGRSTAVLLTSAGILGLLLGAISAFITHYVGAAFGRAGRAECEGGDRRRP